MKNIVTKSTILAAASLVILGMAVPAYASNDQMRMDIPFSFLVGEQRMPAGIYVVRLDADFHTLDLMPVNDTKSCRVRVKDSLAMRKQSETYGGALSFLKYGSTLVLRNVFVPGATERHDLQVSHAEIELAREGAPELPGVATVRSQNR